MDVVLNQRQKVKYPKNLAFFLLVLANFNLFAQIAQKVVPWGIDVIGAAINANADLTFLIA